MGLPSARRLHGQGSFGGDLTGPNPTDRGKLGTKRSILTDGYGVPISAIIDGANRHDSVLLEATIASIPIGRPLATPDNPHGMCLDKAFDSTVSREILAEYNYIPHIRSRGQEKTDLASIPGHRARRWVVERLHSWLNRFRRLLIRWEKKSENYLGFLHFVCGLIAFRSA